MLKRLILASVLLTSGVGPTPTPEIQEPPIVEPTEPIEPIEPTEPVEPVEPVEPQEPQEPIEPPVEEEEMTMEEFKEKVSQWMEQYLNKEFIADCINWAINSGLLVALFGIYLKYRKYKSMSGKEIAEDVQKTIEKNMEATMKKMSTEELKENADRLQSLEDTLNVVIKALVLSQDKTSEGKKAMLDLIVEKSKNEEVKETTKVVEEKVIEEQKVVEEVKQEVKNDYTPID